MFPPQIGVSQVSVKACEKLIVHNHFAAFETVPEAIGSGAGNGVVHPSWWDVLGEFIVENGLERGDYLHEAQDLSMASSDWWI